MGISTFNDQQRGTLTHHEEEGNKSQAGYTAAEPNHLPICLWETQMWNIYVVDEEHTISIIVRFLNMV